MRTMVAHAFDTSKEDFNILMAIIRKNIHTYNTSLGKWMKNMWMKITLLTIYWVNNPTYKKSLILVLLGKQNILSSIWITSWIDNKENINQNLNIVSKWLAYHSIDNEKRNQNTKQTLQQKKVQWYYFQKLNVFQISNNIFFYYEQIQKVSSIT